MKMNDAFSQILINAIHDAGYEPRSYSGRGMYGRSCVGVTVDRGTSAFNLAAEIIASSADPVEMADSLCKLNVSQDSMGLDSIIYFPNVPWVEEETEENDLDDLAGPVFA